MPEFLTTEIIDNGKPHYWGKTFDREFREYLETNIPAAFTVLHQVSVEIYKKKLP